MNNQINQLVIKGKPSITDAYKVAKTEVVEENGKKTETAYNKNGQVLKTSIFVDQNGDGRYEQSEAVSIKFYDVSSKSSNTREYRDTNNDGSYDEIVENDWTGKETVQRFNGVVDSKSHKMSDVYGSKKDTINEWFKGT